MKKPNKMKFTQLLSILILEDSRLEFLHDKYVHEPKKGERPDPTKKAIPFEIFKEIVKADPTAKFPEGFDFNNTTYDQIKEKVNAGKYTEWIIKGFLKMKPETDDIKPGTPEYNEEMKEMVRLFMEDLYKVNMDLIKFTKYKSYFPQDKRDINKFSSPDDLYRFLISFELPEKIKKELEKKELKKEVKKERQGVRHPGSEIIFVGNNYTVVKIEGGGPKQQEAARWFGGYHEETRWCTSPENSNYFQQYIKQGPIYEVIPNNDNGNVGHKTGLPMDRFQFHFPTEQFKDVHNESIDLIKFLTGEGAELKELFKPMFLYGKGSTESLDSTSVELKLSSKKGKIIAIYGFDEFFDNLSPNLEKLSIDNDTNNEVAIDIPESIGNLTKLRTLNFKKCVKSIPNSFCNCKELFAITITENKQLRTLPECLPNNKAFEFINAKNNPNLKLPKAFFNPEEWDNVENKNDVFFRVPK